MESIITNKVELDGIIFLESCIMNGKTFICNISENGKHLHENFKKILGDDTCDWENKKDNKQCSY